MQLHGPSLLLSATDLAQFLGCRHRTGLEIAVAKGQLKRPFRKPDPLLDILVERGLAHEAAYVATLKDKGKTVVDISKQGGDDGDGDAYARTIAAMKNGADVIVQGTLRDAQWLGKPDILQRIETPSALGTWSYEVADTKLARESKAGTILQLCLYSELLAAAQGHVPERFHVVTPNVVNPVESYRFSDFAAYFRAVRRQMLATVARNHKEILGEYYPEPVDHCDVCAWNERCTSRRRDDDHLSLVAGITRTQRRELEAQSIGTLTTLAQAPLPLPFKPGRGSRASYERAREQARVQLESRELEIPRYELLAIEEQQGLCRLPEPTPGDIFVDLEGDPFATEGGREYLFGVVTADGKYQARWGTTDADERAAFEWFMDLVAKRIAEHPGMHVYHYAPYEPSAFKRLMGRYVTREAELDAMLRSGRFVDLYAVVRQGMRVGVERYSIKNLELMYGYTRSVELVDARKALVAMECALETGTVALLPDEVRKAVEEYNRDDCVSALKLRDWLEGVRAQVVASGTDVPRRVLEDGDAPESVDEREQAVQEMRARLLTDVAEERSERNAAQQARWLLAYMLDYHRREDKATWHRLFELAEKSEEDLFDERDAVAGLTFVGTVDIIRNKRTGKPTGSVIDRYEYPVQEMEIGPRCEVFRQDRKKFAEVVAVDHAKRTIDIRKGPSVAGEHPSSLFEFDHVNSKPIEDALMRIGAKVAESDTDYRATRALLAAEAPRLTNGVFMIGDGESASDFAVRIVGSLDGCVLPIQGPPGAGKTYCGAQMICALLKQGKKVGVTANSHAVIRNLLDKVADAATKLGVNARIVQRVGKNEAAGGNAGEIRLTDSDDVALGALASGEANVVGGTAWLWSKEGARGAVDVLFVDEAGQMALANAVAVSQAASSMVLLGDPQQLEQPRKGSHPDGVGVSALQHLLGDALTIPKNRGIFLPETWRMAPSICAFTSELFYEGRLQSRDGLERQRLTGAEGMREHGLHHVQVAHDGNRNHSVEEIAEIDRLVATLTNGSVQWVDATQRTQTLRECDILIVTPYNAQVNRLVQHFANRDVAIGTVDKFQGQEAPVVIYSMATSRPEDAPRGMEFLYSLNRLNVATSRARCLAILVSSPKLFEPECRTPRQMRLANAVARFGELARRAC